MHILIAAPAFPPFVGGGERHTGTLARHLIDHGHVVTIFTSAALKEPDFWLGCGQDVEIVNEGLNLTIIKTPIRPLPGGFRSLLVWRKSMVILSALPGTLVLMQRMAEQMPSLQKVGEALARIHSPVDIVHGFNISWEYAMMVGWRYARRQGRPFVASPLAHFGTGKRDPVALNSTMRHQQYMLSTSDLLLTNTALEARGLQERGIDQVAVKVAGPGVDTPETVAVLPESGIALKPYVLFVGRTSFDKGAMHAVQAVLRLRQHGSRIQLVIIGRETEEFRRFFKELPAVDRKSVHVLGFVQESLKHAYLREAEALLLPSRTDSFGIVLLESWLYGRPVIAAAAGGIPAVVDDRQNGVLVPFGDVSALAEAIKLLTENQALSRAMGEKGNRKLLDQYTWQAVTEKVLDAYQEALEMYHPPLTYSSK